MSTETQTAQPTVAAKHRAMWASGDYSAIVTDLVAPIGPVLVEATSIGPGDRVLDVAAGTGSVAIPAAQTGADVVASDLTPELLAQGRAAAEGRGITLQWREANAEAMPFGDNEFDAVVSSIGVMFAPHHQAAADELVRVCKPGGRIGVISWTPEGFIGQMFATMKPYVAAPPPGAQPPPLWGDEAHVRALLGDRVDGFAARRDALTVEHFSTGAAFRDYFKANYGPTIAAYRNIADDAERVAALDAELADLGDKWLGGSGVMAWEYLLVTCRKR
ncbi:MAG: class I SAM-dependent methyltransferase [Candidatus Sericytochromatia bacterium]